MLTKLNPDARAVKTSINLVPAGTLIFKPVNIPLEIVPIEITPVSEGVNVTVVPGTTVIVLFGAIDSYNFASIVIVLPTNDNAAVVEKNTSIEVMTPSLGIVKAKFVNVPDGLVKSIVLPMIDIPGAELPNPINAGVPTKPPAIVVKDTGKPDANGIIAEAPAAPVDPVGPVDPVAPVAPSSPVAPVGPVAPVAPSSPVAPVGPVAPVAPVAPVGPVGHLIIIGGLHRQHGHHNPIKIILSS